MPNNVTYHQESGEDRSYVILAENSDGTVDVGPDGGPVVISNCQVSKKAEFGKVTIDGAAQTNSDSDASLESKKVDELREIAKGLEIDHEGLKKAELIEAITAAQTNSDTEV